MTASAATGLWTRSPSAAPQRGGTFKVGMHDGNSSDTHDPGKYTSRQQIYLAHQYRSYLTLIAPDGTLGPDLATDWSANDDASVWTFELNPNASFHSGKPVTANDVVASSTTTAETIRPRRPRALLTDVTDISPMATTVVVELAAATPICRG